MVIFRFLLAGITLENAGASVTWDPVGNADTELQTANFKLHIKQILLGHTAKEGEYNVVQVSSVAFVQKQCRHFYGFCSILRLCQVTFQMLAFFCT